MDLNFSGSKVSVAPVTTTTSSEVLLRGQPVYVNSNNSVALASSLTAKMLGLTDSYANGVANIKTEGCFESFDWTDVTGAVTLIPGANYFLDSVAGMLSAFPPTSQGQFVVKVGTAVSETKMAIRIGETILL